MLIPRSAVPSQEHVGLWVLVWLLSLNPIWHITNTFHSKVLFPCIPRQSLILPYLDKEHIIPRSFVSLREMEYLRRMKFHVKYEQCNESNDRVEYHKNQVEPLTLAVIFATGEISICQNRLD